MEARAAREGEGGARLPTWLLGLVPLALIAAAAIAFALLDAPGLGERVGPPVEEVAVERTVLRPGEIELTLRNDGPDAVAIEQVAISDSYVPFETSDEEIDRLASSTLTMTYPWIEGEAYEIFILTSTGGTIDHEIPVAVESPETDTSFFGLMALLGVYVGVIPVAMGMLWLPFVRRIDPSWIRFLLAFTIGLLVFLAVDATLEGLEIAVEGPQAFGGAALVFLGALSAFLALAAVTDGSRAAASECARGGRRVPTSRSSWRSGSVFTTSGRASRSAPRMRGERSRSAPSSSSASRSTTRPRGWRSSRRSRRARPRSAGSRCWG
jgi:hypothetical protein